MSHVYKATQWQSPTGYWYVADTSALERNSASWLIPPKVFGISNEEYIIMLKEKYHVSKMSMTNILLFSWEKESDAHKYLLDINRIARNKKFMV